MNRRRQIAIQSYKELFVENFMKHRRKPARCARLHPSRRSSGGQPARADQRRCVFSRWRGASSRLAWIPQGRSRTRRDLERRAGTRSFTGSRKKNPLQDHCRNATRWRAGYPDLDAFLHSERADTLTWSTAGNGTRSPTCRSHLVPIG